MNSSFTLRAHAAVFILRKRRCTAAIEAVVDAACCKSNVPE
ncbi:hypothetical protein AIOL_004099 [Candidatus Rhodobacter oscarellae]|uniref:Uncharacterized protein n=1 Tax=Candidatus Rhodobacter oscarellae TaxID=1675527 RepID=A0A0J9H059_9RHOB|nr:hypothetical protein AIOL_004099 [Candidatus Rhodobacter lobularis]